MTEIENMKKPDRWPVWPFLPLKRKGSNFMQDKALGYLFNRSISGDHTETIVYIGNMFEAVSSGVPSKETVKYDSFEALADEWRVD